MFVRRTNYRHSQHRGDQRRQPPTGRKSDAEPTFSGPAARPGPQFHLGGQEHLAGSAPQPGHGPPTSSLPCPGARVGEAPAGGV